MITTLAFVNVHSLTTVDRPELARTFASWRAALPIGVLSLGGSTGWAVAVTLENAAKVRTLGQVELLLAFATSHRPLGELHPRPELLARALVLVALAGVVHFGSPPPEPLAPLRPFPPCFPGFWD